MNRRAFLLGTAASFSLAPVAAVLPAAPPEILVHTYKWKLKVVAVEDPKTPTQIIWQVGKDYTVWETQPDPAQPPA